MPTPLDHDPVAVMEFYDRLPSEVQALVREYDLHDVATFYEMVDGDLSALKEVLEKNRLAVQMQTEAELLETCPQLH